MEQSSEHIWFLVARKFSGEASPEELAELEILLLQNPAENYSMEILHDLWNSPTRFNRQYSENKYKQLVLRMQHSGVDEGYFDNDNSVIRADVDLKPRRAKKWFLWMASFAITGLAVFFLLQNIEGSSQHKPQEAVVKNEINTKYGSKTNILLPDGSKVWLNAGSKMTYSKDYGVNIREVHLTGEAYFDVIKDAKRPFIIHTNKIDIRVLGTAFNVKCYPDEKNTETSLVRGSLEVSMKDRPEKIILKPNEKLIVSNSEATDENQPGNTGKKELPSLVNRIELSQLSILPQDNSIVETSWVNNILVFRSESFEEVAHKMERWYAVGISFADEKLKSRKFTGVFENETIDQALSAMQLTAAFSYKITDDKIIISNKN